MVMNLETGARFLASLFLLAAPMSAAQFGLYTYEVVGDTVTITDFPEDAVGHAEIPTEIDGMPVVTIGAGAFWKCGRLTSVTIPESVTNISEGAFSECVSLTIITIPNSVTTIKDEAFSKCTSLTSIAIPNSVTTIGNEAFRQCGRLTKFTIPTSMTTIGEWTFHGCHSLTNVTIPDSVTTISEGAFHECGSLGNVTIPKSVKTIGDEAFYKCSSLTILTIPESVTYIGESAFSYCTRLMRLTIYSSGGMLIGDKAFFGCYSLPRVTFLGDAPRFSGAKRSHGVFGQSGPLHYDLRLMSVSDVSELPVMGNMMTIVAWVGDDLHIRIFDADGRQAIDKPEVELLKAPWFSDLKKIREEHPSLDESTMSPERVRAIVDMASGSSDYGFRVYYLSSRQGYTLQWKEYFSKRSVVMMDEAAYPAVPWLVRHGLAYDTNLHQEGLLMAYALNFSPHSRTSLLPEPIIDPATDTLNLSFHAASPGITYIVESSADLQSWSTDGVRLSDLGADNKRTAMVDRDSGNRFLRLRVDR